MGVSRLPPPKLRTPEDSVNPSESEYASNTYSSDSLSVGSLSLSDEEVNQRLRRHRVNKNKSSVRITKPKKDVVIKLPSRHKSLIGHKKEMGFLKRKLQLSRTPCNLHELRRCKSILNFCNYVVTECKIYMDLTSPHRRLVRDFLNMVLTLPIKNLFGAKPQKDLYSPNLPSWLYRWIIKSLSIGNGIPCPSVME